MSDIFTACDNDHLTLLNTIIVERPTDINLSQGGVPILNKAIIINRDIFAERLIVAGANLNIRSNNYGGGDFPLMLASRKNNARIVEILIDYGADINYTDTMGITALMAASTSNRPDIVNILLNRGANIDFISYIGETALFKAVILERENIVDILLNRGANVNIRNIHGDTALMKAVLNGNKNIVIKLIIKGADTTIRSNFGHTPLETIERILERDNDDLRRLVNTPEDNIEFMMSNRDQQLARIRNKIQNDEAIIEILKKTPKELMSREKLDMILYGLNSYDRSNFQEYLINSGLEGNEATFSGLLQMISDYYSGLDSGNIQNKKSKRKKSRRKSTGNKNSKRKSIRKNSRRKRS